MFARPNARATSMPANPAPMMTIFVDRSIIVIPGEHRR
jgi:hypothetical protein